MRKWTVLSCRFLVNRVVCGGFIAALLSLATFTASGETLKPSEEPVLTPAAIQHFPIVIRERHGSMVTSSNWSGYAVTGAPGTITAVTASWVVPAIQGPCPATRQYSSFWVGIDGFNSNTVEQIGTDSDCQNGVPTYYAWFELYPHPSFTINTLSISPGDVIAAGVVYRAGQFTLAIRNQTTGQSFETTAAVQNAQLSSAEWIAEAPAGLRGVLPLADFGLVVYGDDNTGVPMTSGALVNGTKGFIGAFGASVQQITMVGTSGTTEATPSSISSDGSSFSVQWASSTP
jgi:hypothetical protein